jgi:hypothetical protein
MKQSHYPTWGALMRHIRMKRQFCSIQDLQHVHCQGRIILICYQSVCKSNGIKSYCFNPQSLIDNDCDKNINTGYIIVTKIL